MPVECRQLSEPAIVGTVRETAVEKGSRGDSWLIAKRSAAFGARGSRSQNRRRVHVRFQGIRHATPQTELSGAVQRGLFESGQDASEMHGKHQGGLLDRTVHVEDASSMILATSLVLRGAWFRNSVGNGREIQFPSRYVAILKF